MTSRNNSTASDISTDSDDDLAVPFSLDFFKALSNAEIVLVYTSGVLAVLTIGLFFEETNYVLRCYATPKSIRYQTIQVILLYPVTSLVAMLSLCVPRSAPVCFLVGLCFIAKTMYSFVMLIDKYFGGKHGVLTVMENTRVSLRVPPICCCFVCIPTVKVTSRSLRVLKLMMLQSTIIQPVTSFIAVILWLDGLLLPEVMEPSNGGFYINAINVLSIVVSIFGMVVCVRNARSFLGNFHIGIKFTVIQLAYIFYNLQNVAFRTLAKRGFPGRRGILSSEVRYKTYQNMLLIFEIFLVSMVARFAYHRSHAGLPVRSVLDDKNALAPDDKRLSPSGSSPDMEKAMEGEITKEPLIENHNNCHHSREGIDTSDTLDPEETLDHEPLQIANLDSCRETDL